jgi:(p)ppGpp synthase/HD superfamily hydrolase
MARVQLASSIRSAASARLNQRSGIGPGSYNADLDKSIANLKKPLDTPDTGSTGVPDRAPAPVAASDSAGLVADALRLLDESCPGQIGRNGEAVLGHAEGTLAILREVQADEPTCIAAALFGAGGAISLDAVRQRFGAEVATLVDGMRQALKLRELHRPSVRAATGRGSDGEQLETLRRMPLAMASTSAW